MTSSSQPSHPPERELYLELLKSAVTGALAPDALARLSRPDSLPKRVVHDALTRRGITPARHVDDIRPYVEEGRPVGALLGDTMVGRRRLDHLQDAIGRVLDEGVPGDLIEAGAWRGGTSVFMRGVLAAAGVTDRRVWVADSFEGLPTDDRRHAIDSDPRIEAIVDLGVSRADVEAAFERYGLLDDQVVFLEGWFSDTLPGLSGERWALVRIDADMYGSTNDALTHLYPSLSAGGYVVIDDYGDLEPCRAAVDDFRERHGIREPLEQIDWSAVCWRRGGNEER